MGRSTVFYYVLVPDVSGTYTMKTELQYEDGGEYRAYDEYSLSIELQAGLEDQVDALIEEMRFDGGDKEIQKAKRHLEKIRGLDHTKRKGVEKAIREVLKAVEHLRKAGASDLRQRADMLLRGIEAEWYFL